MDEDEDPKKSGAQPNVMQYFSQDEERARSIAQAEPNHLHKDQDDSKNVQTGHEDLDKSDQKKRNDDDSLTLHHKGSAPVFLQKLTSEESYSYLQQV